MSLDYYWTHDIDYVIKCRYVNEFILLYFYEKHEADYHLIS